MSQGRTEPALGRIINDYRIVNDHGLYSSAQLVLKSLGVAPE